MKAEDKLQILKFLLMLVNSFFVILGISLFGCSAWILFDKNNFIAVLNGDSDIEVVAGGLFVIGLVIVVVSMLGCVSVHMENRCFITFYMGFLIAIVLGQLFITFLLLFKRNQIETVLTEIIDGIIAEYGRNTTQTSGRLLDSVQQSTTMSKLSRAILDALGAKCCGRKSASDWQTNGLIQTLNMSDVYPCSCFNSSCPLFLPNESHPFGNGSDIYTTGCGVKLKDWFEQNVLVIVGMDLGLIAIQILQFTLGVYIYRNIGIKIKDRLSRKLLQEQEENPAPEPELPQSDQEYYQHHEAYMQQPQDFYDQEYAGQSYSEDQPHTDHDLEVSHHFYGQQHPSVYAQEDSGQTYDQHQYQQHPHHPEPTRHIYDPEHENTYDQEYFDQSYDQFQDQQYQTRNDLDYPQTNSGIYNQGYVQNYDSRTNYDTY